MIIAAPARFYSLDALRGLAALSVVFWHWQHFFYVGTRPGQVDVDRLPFYDLTFFLYHKGYLAVDLFFALSGFVFYWLYAQRIAERHVGAREFFVLRFSRLYPLHLATLLAVAVAQWVLHREAGIHFIYEQNDTRHFVLNLLFASSWGFESGWSFNAPVWSVSVEVFLYLVFFLLCRALPLRLPLSLALAAGGYLLAEFVHAPIGRGIHSFFLGGSAYLACVMVRDHGWSGRLVVPLATASILGWIALAFAIRHDWPVDTAATTLLFPLTLLALATIETVHTGFGRRFAFLGEISYASYLLHFPLQFLFFLAAVLLGAGQGVFYTEWMVLLYFAALVTLSFASYHWFERPLQGWLRRKMLAG